MFQRDQKGGRKMAFGVQHTKDSALVRVAGVNRGIKGRDDPCNADADICLTACLALKPVSYLPGANCYGSIHRITS